MRTTTKLLLGHRLHVTEFVMRSNLEECEYPTQVLSVGPVLLLSTKYSSLQLSPGTGPVIYWDWIALGEYQKPALSRSSIDRHHLDLVEPETGVGLGI